MSKSVQKVIDRWNRRACALPLQLPASPTRNSLGIGSAHTSNQQIFLTPYSLLLTPYFLLLTPYSLLLPIGHPNELLQHFLGLAIVDCGRTPFGAMSWTIRQIGHPQGRSSVDNHHVSCRSFLAF
jgi:hypothetical protein